MIARAASVISILLLALWGAGCSLTKQSAGDLNAGLRLVVPPQTSADWPMAKQGTTRLAASPRVIVAWAPSEPREGAVAAYATKANREAWVAAMRQKIEHSGVVTSAMGAAPDHFDDGVTVVGVQRLAENYAADVVVLFTVEVRKRRYHTFETVSGSPGGQTSVENQMEVTALAYGVGLTASGVPVLSATQKGFASGTPARRSIEELEAISKRTALDSLADAVVERLRLVAPEAKRR
ncbi:MAG: hypothetical protein ACOYXU_08815 [Nitrospirota bacterium]